jgi:hypothetical protein
MITIPYRIRLILRSGDFFRVVILPLIGIAIAYGVYLAEAKPVTMARGRITSAYLHGSPGSALDSQYYRRHAIDLHLDNSMKTFIMERQVLFRPSLSTLRKAKVVEILYYPDPVRARGRAYYTVAGLKVDGWTYYTPFLFEVYWGWPGLVVLIAFLCFMSAMETRGDWR